MDLLTKNLMLGKIEKVKAMESQCTVATNVDREANYVSNQEVFEVVAKGIKLEQQISQLFATLNQRKSDGKEVVEKSEESSPVESEKLDSSVDASDKNFIMASKGESPHLTKKEQQKSVRRKLIDEESDYEKKNLCASEQEASEHSKHEQHKSEYAESGEEEQEGFEESESEGTVSGSPSTKKQDEESPARGTLIKCPVMEESEEEIPILDLTGDSPKKKKKRGEKKRKDKGEELDREEERRVKKKAEKEEFKKVRIESLAENDKWEAVIRARDAGASSSKAPTTARLSAPDREKIADDAAKGSETHKTRA
ncbi:CAX-interacting protein 4-like [Capsicum annuum]|uniref:CAX-interacting protein 4-like n=1 Tax=Capsicum annuum TaxID=4072 RepID=UPI001FB064AD|nr:CAX-interacting protein 4-like [Capsicum annuum]